MKNGGALYSRSPPKKFENSVTENHDLYYVRVIPCHIKGRTDNFRNRANHGPREGHFVGYLINGISISFIVRIERW
jgi:hypothetical protein